MLADLLRHHASEFECDWAVCVSRKQHACSVWRYSHCPCYDIASAGTRPTPFLIQIMWVPLKTELGADLAGSKNNLLCC